MPTLKQRASLAWRAALGIFSDSSAHQAYGLLRGMWPSGVGEPPVRGARERVGAYADMPWVFALADKVAYAFATVDWHVYVVRPKGSSKAVRAKWLQDAHNGAARRRTMKALSDRGELVEVANHQLVDALNAGNAMMTGLAVRKVTALHLDLEGECFWMKERDQYGVPIKFWPLPPDWVRATPTATNPAYLVSFRGWHGAIPDSEIAWLPNPNPSNPYGRGTGVVRALADELETDEYAARSTRQTFFNQARPDFIVSPGEEGVEWGEPQRQRLAQDWAQQHEGFWRVAKARFASRKLNIYEFAQTDHRKLEMTKLREFERDLIRQCHDPETEALTKRGWVRGLELREDDEVAIWDPYKGRMEFTVPAGLIVKDHDGVIHHWKTSAVDVAVTPNHRMLVWSPRKRGWEFISSEEQRTASARDAHWRTTGDHPGGGVETVDIPHIPYERAHRKSRAPESGDSWTLDARVLAEWLGYYLSEGSASHNGKTFKMTCSQTTPSDDAAPTGTAERIERVSRAVAASGVASLSVVRKSRLTRGRRAAWDFTLSSKSLHAWVTSRAGVGCHEKRIPREVFGWTREAQVALLDALVAGDGHQPGPETAVVGTMSPRLVDDVQELAAYLGLRATVRESRGRGHHAPRSVYVARGVSVSVKRSDCAVVPYVGKVWCVDVGGLAFVTRRNGKMVVHGNTWGVPPEIMGIVEPGASRATITRADYVFSKWVVEPRLEMFRALLQVRLVPEYDERIIIDYDSPIQDDKEFALEVAKAAPFSLTVDEWRAMGQREALGSGGDLHALPNDQSFGPLDEKDTATKPAPTTPGKPKPPKKR